MNIAIIPARGGSKRIPRKNIKEFCGKPMIAYSIEAAQKSELFDQIVVSTDDDEIATVAQYYGADVLQRPKALADDLTPTIPVIAHALKTLDIPNLHSVCCLYATAPFIQPKYLQEGYAKLKSTQSAYVFSATTYAFPIQRAIKLKDDHVEMFSPENFAVRSQDLEEAYHDAGQFYWGMPEAWLEEKIIFAPHSTAIVLPRHLVQDIDTPEDWVRAELMYKVLYENADTK